MAGDGARRWGTSCSPVRHHAAGHGPQQHATNTFTTVTATAVTPQIPVPLVLTDSPDSFHVRSDVAASRCGFQRLRVNFILVLMLGVMASFHAYFVFPISENVGSINNVLNGASLGASERKGNREPGGLFWAPLSHAVLLELASAPPVPARRRAAPVSRLPEDLPLGTPGRLRPSGARGPGRAPVGQLHPWLFQRRADDDGRGARRSPSGRTRVGRKTTVASGTFFGRGRFCCLFFFWGGAAFFLPCFWVIGQHRFAPLLSPNVGVGGLLTDLRKPRLKTIESHKSPPRQVRLERTRIRISTGGYASSPGMSDTKRLPDRSVTPGGPPQRPGPNSGGWTPTPRSSWS